LLGPERSRFEERANWLSERLATQNLFMKEEVEGWVGEGRTMVAERSERSETLCAVEEETKQWYWRK
jgi:hypothetical protein